MNFSHSGAAGDIIYALPTMQAMGGGDLYLFPRVGPWVNSAMADALRPLLESQPYVTSVRFTPATATVSLDMWRRCYINGLSIAEIVARAFNVDPDIVNRPWVNSLHSKFVAPVIVHRSPRYHNDGFPWKRVVEKYRGNLVMVGMPDEHQAFCSQFGQVPYHPTKDYLELAEVIAGSFLFIGNQSSPYAVAEAMKHNSLQEVCTYTANCLFNRPNAGYGVDDRLFLPELP